MPGLVPGIHVYTGHKQEKTWMAGTSVQPGDITDGYSGT
jgi:hypothetical protein